MSESTSSTAPPAATDSTASASSTTSTDTSASSSSFSSSASSSSSTSSSASSSSSATALPPGVTLIPAERNDFYVGAPIYVRQQAATVTVVDWPHVYWRTATMADDQQKHRSFTDSRDIFTIDQADRGKKPTHAAQHAATHAAAHQPHGLMLSTGGGGGGGGGLVDDEEEDDDDDDDDDEEFTVAAVTAVLKPGLAQKAIAVMEERRSPKHSPKGKQFNSAASAVDSGEGGGGEGEGKSEEGSQLVDSDL